MNGREQVAQYAQLWQPDQLAGFRVGDLVDLQTIGRCEVIELLPPSELRLRASSGAILKCGWRIARKVT